MAKNGVFHFLLFFRQIHSTHRISFNNSIATASAGAASKCTKSTKYVDNQTGARSIVVANTQFHRIDSDIGQSTDETENERERLFAGLTGQDHYLCENHNVDVDAEYQITKQTFSG